MNDYKFGNFLYQLRTEKGLSQSQLGEMMGVSNKAVSKWEMGVSKPRPSMLVSLASFFGVTVEELLAGERSAEEEKGQQERDETALKLWTGEYRKKKKRGRNAVITALTLPLIFFICVGLFAEFGVMDQPIGPIVMMISLFAEAIDIALIFVFFGSARRMRRLLYSTYPEHAEMITAIISPKKERIALLKWEKICLIACSSIIVVCNTIRLVIVGLEMSESLRAVSLTVSWFGLLASIAMLVVWIHALVRTRRKK